MNTHMIDYASICIYIHIQYMIVCSYMSILSVNIDAYRCICRERTPTWTIDTYDGQYLSIRFVNITNISKSGKISKHSTMAATMLATLCSSIPALGGSSVCSLVTCLPPVISSWTSCCVFGNGWLNTWPCSSHKSLERFGRFNRHMGVTWCSLWPQNAKQICMDPSTGRQMDISCSSLHWCGTRHLRYRSNLHIAFSHASIFSRQTISCCSGSHCTFAPSMAEATAR